MVRTAILVLCVAATLDSQRTLRVPSEYGAIMSAMTAARDGDTILVAPGAYMEPIDFLGKAVALRSEGGPAVTWIGLSAVNTRMIPVVLFATDEGAGSILDGFRIEDGNAAGIRVESASPTIRNCRIRKNAALPTTAACLPNGTCVGEAYGGGIYLSNSRARIVDCLIEKNFATVSRVNARSPLREAYAEGGGIYATRSFVVVDRCFIASNSAIATPDAGYTVGHARGGGVRGVTVTNSYIAGNQAKAYTVAPYPGSGGGASDSTVVHCVVYGNSTGPGGTGTGLAGGVAVNSIIRGNGPGRGQVDGTDATSCNVEGGAPGAGNIDADPKYVDNASHIGPDSPCRDAGTRSVAGLPRTDHEGDPRDVGAAPDIGLDEFFARLRRTGNPTPGGRITIEIHGDPGRATVLAFSPDRLPTPLAFPGILGTLEINPWNIAFIPLGPMPASGVTRFPYAFAPTFPPITIHVQAAVGSQLARAIPLNVR